ncbi:YdcF family protein [Phytoactinopolyspora halotolerans]|uniref:YdcF family protein n=1 Tax=Phytoactinopolyspora halotolerans TaxID=1981512 RepID=A0A6L9S3J4_9ACTN|nr:YdcF family protein [Phytoactinopolyspora halotolerans]NED99608.1 YdcF family protein [Phytoactinopolyspora halotolerans]
MPARRRVWLAVALVLVAVVQIRVFLLPPTDESGQADAIVVFGGPGDRLGYAAELMADGLAPTLVISTEDVNRCPPGAAGAEVLCLTPDPLTTRGEARAFAELARERGWEELLVVSTATQSVRARMRLDRCYAGHATYVAMRENFLKQMYRVVYENGAMVKALFVERDC